MPNCITIPLLLVGIILLLVSVIRWFELVSLAVDTHDWKALQVLLICPPMCWRYRSTVGASRPVPVPHHEPVRGFGKVSLEDPRATGAPPTVSDGPPPGTPAEFLGMPVIPPKSMQPKKPPVDADKIARLKQKMREQGMLPPES